KEIRKTEFPVVAFYEGRHPSLDKLAVLTVITPNDDDGVCVVGRIQDSESRRDYRPPVKQALLELRPGQYRLEVYYWIARSRFDRSGALVIENLKSATVVPMTIDVAAGDVYTIEPELRRSEDLSLKARERFHPLAVAASFAQVKSPPPERRQVVKTHVWRPHLKPLPTAKAKQYR
ncbi:MAG: hypothetical protein ACYS0D_10700, partial [Planctomycetota bacterium]